MKMKRPLSLVLALATLTGLSFGTVGCKSPSGSREYIPGKGWKSTQTVTPSLPAPKTLAQPS